MVEGHERRMVFERLQTILAEMTKVHTGEISSTTGLIDDLGFDSLKWIDLNISVERAFELDDISLQEWADREAERATSRRYTVESLVDYICEVRHSA